MSDEFQAALAIRMLQNAYACPVDLYWLLALAADLRGANVHEVGIAASILETVEAVSGEF